MKQRENPEKYIEKKYTEGDVPLVIFDFEGIRDNISVREQDERIIVTRTGEIDSSISFEKNLYENITDSSEIEKESVVYFLYTTMSHACNYIIWESSGDMILEDLLNDEVNVTHRERMFSLELGRACYKKYQNILDTPNIAKVNRQLIEIEFDES